MILVEKGDKIRMVKGLHIHRNRDLIVKVGTIGVLKNLIYNDDDKLEFVEVNLENYSESITVPLMMIKPIANDVFNLDEESYSRNQKLEYMQYLLNQDKINLEEYLSTIISHTSEVLKSISKLDLDKYDKEQNLLAEKLIEVYISFLNSLILYEDDLETLSYNKCVEFTKESIFLEKQLEELLCNLTLVTK